VEKKYFSNNRYMIFPRQHSSRISCSRFDAQHYLPARSISEQRLK